MLCFVVFSVLSAVLLGYAYSKWRYSYWKRKGVPQLDPSLPFGDTNPDKSLAETYYDFYQQFRMKDEKFGGVYTMLNPVFVPVDPDLVKQIILRDFDHFTAHFPKFNNPTIFMRSLFHLQGDEWKFTRKKLTPTFTSGKMKMMYEILRDKTTYLTEMIGDITKSGEPFKVKDTLERFTTDVIGTCGFGLECNSMKDPESEFLKNGRSIFQGPDKKPGVVQLILRATQFGRTKLKHIQIENFFKKVVSETIHYRETNKIIRPDFMHLMIQLKNQGHVSEDDQIFTTKNPNKADAMTEEEVTAQCLLFFIAGFETSATTMTYALLELAQHEDIQEKVRKEVKEVLEKHNGVMTYEAMLDLKYTENVIQETLRKYPPVAVVPRVCTKDYKIHGTDIIIKKGTPTFISAWGLHKDPEYFPNPEKFDPERFNPENKHKIRDFSYIPFGEGPRMCLGLRFGMMQSKMGLATLIRNYRVTLNKKTFFPLKLKRFTFITTLDGDLWLNAEKI
ncbi:cytochrome P450 6k1-like [Sitophilus oryzae]|uniref:Cytochrome P450 6k1-like n=1 Tax=Sitophilus oryzae TaxID=7048 RepID=A0A6J2YWD0_SITOR|nr:cytochrome P450 6k1-like [Sitophilus oryzae]